MVGIWLATMIISSCGNGSGSSEPGTDSSAALAAPAKLDDHAISYRAAQDEIDTFSTHFRLKGAHQGLSSSIGINTAALTELINHFGGSNNNLGVIVSYGLDGSNIVLLFTPFYIDASNNPVKDTKFMKWDGSTFVDVTSTANTLKANYHDNVEAIKTNGGDWIALDENDAVSINISAAEITGVAADNGNATTLYFISDARIVDNIYQHDIAVSASQQINVTIPQGTDGFGNSVDNMHTMCPPMVCN